MTRSRMYFAAVALLVLLATATGNSQLTGISPDAVSNQETTSTTFTIDGALPGSTALLLLKSHAYIPTSVTFPDSTCTDLPPTTDLRTTSNETVDSSSQVTFSTNGLIHGSYVLCFRNLTIPVNTTYVELQTGVVTFSWRHNETNSSMTCRNDTVPVTEDYNVTCDMTIQWYEEKWHFVDPVVTNDEYAMLSVAISGAVHPMSSRVECCEDNFEVGHIYSCALLTYDDIGQLAGSTTEECMMGVCVKDGQGNSILPPLKTVPTFTKLGMYNFTFNATVSGCYASAMGYYNNLPINGGVAAQFKIAAGSVRGWASTAECSATGNVPCTITNRDMWGNPVSTCAYDSASGVTCTVINP